MAEFAGISMMAEPHDFREQPGAIEFDVRIVAGRNRPEPEPERV